jgi:hypothetical protein
MKIEIREANAEMDTELEKQTMKRNDPEHKKLMDERRAAGKLIDPATAVIT